MTPFPIATDDLAELKRFRAALDDKAVQSNDDVKALKAKADQLLVRLGGPVRVAVLGLTGAGKTSLVNFLVGTRLIPPDTGTRPRPPVIVRYDETPKTAAGWWSGIEIAEAGLNLEGAALQEPDFIEFRVPNPILKFISFLDMPRVDDPERQAEQLRWATNRADIVAWCTKATDPWRAPEANLWAPLGNKLLGRSLLIVTHAEGGARKVVERLRAAVSGQFQAVVPIATIEAIKAAPDGKVISAAGWESSGGKTLAASVLSLARAIRNSEIEAARKLISSAPATAKAATEIAVKPAPPPEAQVSATAFAPEAPPLAAEEITVDAELVEPETPPPAKAPAPAKAAEPPAAKQPEPAPKAAAKPEPEPAPEPKPEPKAEPAPKVEAEPKVAPKPQARPEPEPVVSARPKPLVVAESNDPDEDASGGTAMPRRIVTAKHKLAKLVGEEEVEEDTPDQETAPEADEPAAENAPQAPADQSNLLGQFHKRLEAVIAETTAAKAFSADDFLKSATALTKEITSAALAEDAVNADAIWVRAQLAEAVETFGALLQEKGPQQALSGASILLQLARDLSWASSGKAV